MTVLAAKVARAWPIVSAKLSDFFIRFLAIAARFAIVFPLCLFLYHFVKAAEPCFVPLSRVLDLMWCPLIIGIYFGTDFHHDDGGLVPPHYLPMSLLAVAIVVIWTTNDYRRRCGKGWF